MCLHGHLLRCSRVFTTCFQTGHPSQVANNGNKSECVSAVGATRWICVRYLKLSPEIFLQKKKAVLTLVLPLSRKCILGCGSCMQLSHFLCFSGLMRRGVPFLSKGQLLLSPEIGCVYVLRGPGSLHTCRLWFGITQEHSSALSHHQAQPRHKEEGSSERPVWPRLLQNLLEPDSAECQL